MKRLFLIDAFALIFKFYYAFVSRPMRNRDGLNTSAIFGFTKFLNDIIRKEHPDYLGVAFDPGGKTFRSELYPQYKANREETPDDIRKSVPYIKRILEAMGIPILQVEGYEADDVIGTLSQKAAEAGMNVFMVTPDKDYGQLVRPNVQIYKQRRGGDGEIEIVDMAAIERHYGIRDPRQVIDILALWGDASDNIPGVPGIGEKSAVKLVNELGGVDSILSDTSRLKGKQRESIEANISQLRMAKALATIDLNVPIELDSEALRLELPDCLKLREIYKELNFSMFLRDVETMCSNLTSIAKGDTVQRDLFGSVVENRPKTADNTPNTPPTPTEPSLFDNNILPLYKTIDTQQHTYIIAADELQFEAMLSDITRYERIGLDIEVTGPDTFADRIVGISLAVRTGEAYYVPLTPKDANETTRILQKLAPILENDRVEKIGQNLKFVYMMLLNNGIQMSGFFWDVTVMHYLIDPETRHSLDYLAKIYMNYLPISLDEVLGKGASKITPDQLTRDRVAAYLCERSDINLQLFSILQNKLSDLSLSELYAQIEEPLIRVLAEIERNGVKIDVEALNQYGEQLTTQIESLESEIHELTNDPTFNINSAKQLGEILFDRLKIDLKPKTTKSKQYKTDEDYLVSLRDRHPVIDKILDYRRLRKLLSTYITALPAMVNPTTGRIHTSFNQTVTATGRLSSTNPNLQNIPVRDDAGREIRRAFIASDSDHVLVAADYSQVELRVMASLSGDPELIGAFAAGKDIHTATAALIFKTPESEVTREERRKAKTANFGIIYGISAFGLAQRLDIPRSEAKDIIDGYFASYPGVHRYMQEAIEKAQSHGYVTTLFGRRRMLPDIHSGNSNVRGLAERNAINAPIQGSAADIIKIAMVQVVEEFHRRGLRSKLILQVHDELVVDAYRDELDTVTDILRSCMSGASSMTVPLVVDVGIGENWLDAH